MNKRVYALVLVFCASILSAADVPEDPSFSFGLESSFDSGKLEAKSHYGIEFRLTNYAHDIQPFIAFEFSKFDLDVAKPKLSGDGTSMALLIGRGITDLESSQINLALGGMVVKQDFTLPGNFQDPQADSSYIGILLQGEWNYFFNEYLEFSLRGRYFVSYEDQKTYSSGPILKQENLYFGTATLSFRIHFPLK